MTVKELLKNNRVVSAVPSGRGHDADVEIFKLSAGSYAIRFHNGCAEIFDGENIIPVISDTKIYFLKESQAEGVRGYKLSDRSKRSSDLKVHRMYTEFDEFLSDYEFLKYDEKMCVAYIEKE